jgi:hypothetical protein
VVRISHGEDNTWSRGLMLNLNKLLRLKGYLHGWFRNARRGIIIFIFIMQGSSLLSFQERLPLES